MTFLHAKKTHHKSPACPKNRPPLRDGEREAVWQLPQLANATEAVSHLHTRDEKGKGNTGCLPGALLVPKHPILQGSSIV